MSKMVIFSVDLRDFVEKFFVSMDFSDLDTWDLEKTLTILSGVEKTQIELLKMNYGSDEPNLWYNRELSLRGLVVLTQLEHFAKILQEANHLERALILLNRVVESFNQKVMEDPEIIKAIQEDRLEEELEKHFPPEVLSSPDRKSNFSHLLEPSGPLENIPENYEPIPENF